MSDSPCQHCGACCAAFRVTFDEAIFADQPGGYVPRAMAVHETGRLYRMRGTDEAVSRCEALDGEIGKVVACRIYVCRPDPCREFMPHGFVGVDNLACQAARRRHGLPLLATDTP